MEELAAAIAAQLGETALIAAAHYPWWEAMKDVGYTPTEALAIARHVHGWPHATALRGRVRRGAARRAAADAYQQWRAELVACAHILGIALPDDPDAQARWRAWRDDGHPPWEALALARLEEWRTPANGVHERDAAPWENNGVRCAAPFPRKRR